jgi:putative metal-binding protein
MKKLRHRIVLSLILVTAAVAPAVAVEHIFADGFEWGPTCGGTALWFPDVDGDRWGDQDAIGTTVACPAPPGLVPNNNDCDDGNPLINPNAFEVPANLLDDNCDSQTDEPSGICDGGLPSTSSDPRQYAAALDLCRTTRETGRGWGLIRAGLALTSGAGTPAAQSRSIRSAFGSGNFPQAGAAMAVLSTGAAAAVGQTNPAYAAFQVGVDTGTQSTPPGDWLAANGGAFPNAPGCPEPIDSATAHNPVMLTLRVRVPSNARSFRVASSFLSSEYPEWVCSPFNDFFVALLDSTFAGPPANPSDKNLALYASPFGDYPVGVNLASGNTGLFTQCLNGAIGCADGAVAGTISTCADTSGLAGTGMDVANPPGIDGQPGWCGSNNFLGGGTDWLGIQGNVVPGETLELRLGLWDTGDGLYDSVLLLDAFQWSLDLVQPGAFRD